MIGSWDWLNTIAPSPIATVHTVSPNVQAGSVVYLYIQSKQQ